MNEERVHSATAGYAIAMTFAVVISWSCFFAHDAALKRDFDAADAAWKRESIEHGAAYYHPDTGAFTWRDEKPNPTASAPQE